MHTANLTRLASYLDTVPLLGFSMSLYHGNEEDQITPAYECGTVACALGYGPAAGIAPRPHLVYDNVILDWSAYSRQFVDNLDDRLWLFSAEWEHHDNTPTGAAARIRYLLRYGAPPESFNRLNPASFDPEEYSAFISDPA